MRYGWIAFVLMSLLSCSSSKEFVMQEYKYFYYDDYEKADIDYDKIERIDSFPGGKSSMLDVFSPCEGEYRVFRFMSPDYGYLVDDELIDSLNGLVVLKVDSNDIILDGYCILLQQPEWPSSEYILRTNKHIKLKSDIQIDDLDFYPYSRDLSIIDDNSIQRRRYLGFISMNKYKRNKKEKTSYTVFQGKGKDFKRYIKTLKRKNLYP